MTKEQALAQWLKTCQWGDLKDAFYAGWDARAACQTEAIRDRLKDGAP